MGMGFIKHASKKQNSRAFKKKNNSVISLNKTRANHFTASTCVTWRKSNSGMDLLWMH